MTVRKLLGSHLAADDVASAFLFTSSAARCSHSRDSFVFECNAVCSEPLLQRAFVVTHVLGGLVAACLSTATCADNGEDQCM